MSGSGTARRLLPLLWLVGFVAVGLLLGVLLHLVWTPPKGVVVEPPKTQPDLNFILLNSGQTVFAAIGWFVVLAVGAGVLAGVVAGLRRSALWMSLTVSLVGLLLLEVTMWLSARVLGPTDPAELASRKPPGTVLPIAFSVDAPAAWLAGPLGVLVGFVAVGMLGRTEDPALAPDSRAADGTAPDGAPAGPA